jgi:hypothetical protein
MSPMSYNVSFIVFKVHVHYKQCHHSTLQLFYIMSTQLNLRQVKVTYPYKVIQYHLHNHTMFALSYQYLHCHNLNIQCHNLNLHCHTMLYNVKILIYIVTQCHNLN